MGGFTDGLNAWADTLSGNKGSTALYTHETWAQLKTQLANRLQDPSKIFWTDTELGAILTETLRTFSFLTWHWRAQGTFNTVAATIFYELPTQLSTLLGRTVTDRNLINDIQYHFQEPATSVWAGGWTGTAMFTMTDLAHALQKRRNKFLAETGVVVTRTTVASGVPVNGRINLADSVIDLRRLLRENTGGWANLYRVNEQELTAWNRTWTEHAAQDPTEFSILSTPPLTVQLSPAPSASANLDMLTISTGSDFSPTSAATVAGVPDDMAWIVKWGAMADLLQKDGPAQDPERAKYCEERYQHGVQLARLATVITQARLNTTPLLLCSLADLDSFQPGWQSATAGTPDTMATAGLNYIALNSPPSGIIPVVLDVIRNAPIPSSDSDNVQVGREMISTILDYAVHLAMFKIAGDEWQATQQLFEQFLGMCANYNQRMGAASRLWRGLHNITNTEEATRQRIESENA